MIDRQQRFVVDGSAICYCTGRHLRGGHRPLKHSRMRIGLSQLAGDLVPVGRNEVDLDLVHLPALIAVVILHPEIDQVAGTNLRCVPLNRLSKVFVDRLGFPRQLLRDGFLLLVLDLATGCGEGCIRGNADHLDLRQLCLKLFFEFLGIIHMNRIRPGNLKHAIIDSCLSQNGGNFRSKKPLAGAAAGEHHLFTVPPGIGSHADRDLRIAPADPEVTVVYHDEKRFAGSMPAFRLLPQSADGPQHVQLIQKSLLDAKHLGQMVKRLVGEGVFRHALKHGLKHLAGPIKIALSNRHHSHHEFRTQIHLRRFRVA